MLDRVLHLGLVVLTQHWPCWRCKKMRLKLFNIIFMFGILSFNSFALDEDACFKKSFNVALKRSVGPLGAGKRVTSIKKNDCEIVLNYQEFQYRKTNWLIDICREPIHIKKGTDSIEVIKRTSSCLSSKSPFCNEVNVLLSILQDEGLIFAKGGRDNLESDHGKVYCAFFLAKKYLNSDKAFNKGESLQNRLVGNDSRQLSVKTEASAQFKEEKIKDYSQKSEELTNF